MRSCQSVFFLLMTIIGGLLLPLQFLAAQAINWQESGTPYIQNFTTKDYHENPQNWWIDQDQSGIIYIANGHGVLVFDGAGWRMIKTPNKSTVLTVAVKDQRIYTGSNNEIGYLQADRQGRLQYHSLVDLIPEPHRHFGDIWNSAIIGDTLFFRSRTHFFRFVDGTVTVWQPKNSFHSMLTNGNRCFIRKVGEGLYELVGDSLRLISGGRQFANKSVRMIVDYDNGQMLLGTQTEGLYLIDDDAIRPLPGSANSFLTKNLLSHGIRLQPGLYAIATLRGGLAIVDRDGKLLRVFDRSSGLFDQSIKFVYQERPGALWLALNNGIARMEYPAALTRFTAENGISGIGETIVRHQDRLFVGTSDGLHFLQSSTIGIPQFQLVDQIPYYTRHMITTGPEILTATPQGIFQWRQGSVSRIATGWNNVPYFLLHSRLNRDIIFCGLPDGLGVLRKLGNRWTDWGLIRDVSGQVSTMAEDDQGTLWFGTRYAQVIRIEGFKRPLPATPDQLELNIKTYGEEDGLPVEFISPHYIGGKIVFASYHGLKRFESATQRFYADSSFGEAFADSNCWVWRLRETRNGDIWSVANLPGKSLLIGLNERQPDNSFIWRGQPLVRLNDIGLYFDIYPEDNGLAWIGCAEGIGRYDANIPTDTISGMRTIIRRIGGIAGDSVYFGGHTNRNPLPLNLPYDQNSLFFEFSATAFDDISANRYQYFLKGFDKTWSDWNPGNRKEYTNLPAGNYRFQARAKNVYGVTSPAAEYKFTISAPWYQSTLAYAFYVMLLGGMIYGLIVIRVRHLEARNRQLEEIVNQRTVTIREQADKLKEMDRVKSNFFANISHEFRTPLTLILGPLDSIGKKLKSGVAREELKSVKRNARTLLSLINQLLDLSQLESGRMSLQARNGNFIEVLRGLVISFSSLAEQKDIDLQFDCTAVTEEEIDRRLYYDQDKIEKIVFNLLSNAFKFTPNGGKIMVKCGIGSSEFGMRMPAYAVQAKNAELSTNPQSAVSNSQVVIIKVIDTGIGIPPEQLPHIFDRFYQVDSGHTRQQQGTGIGLAHTKELVERHYGKIEVNSTAGKGATFSVALPLDSGHLQPEEISSSQTDLLPAASVEQVTRSSTSPGTPETAASIADSGSIILVIDDHADMRRFVRRQLEKDFQFIEAENGQQGIELAEEVIPDLIICDVMMPKMDGYQVCEALKQHQNTSHIPVILLTAKAGEESKLAGLETGADDYLTKPFSSEELRLRIQNLVDTRRKLRERYRKEGLLQPQDVEVTSMEAEFLQRLKEILESQMEEEDFGVESLCKALGMSDRHLQRKIRALTGQRPAELIRDARLERAKILLEQHSGTISEIAFSVGFNNLSYFSKCFRERFGMAPSAIIRQR